MARISLRGILREIPVEGSGALSCLEIICQPVDLLTALVQKKVGFAGFEGAMSAVSIFAQYELTRHGLRKLAWLSEAISAG